MFKNVLVLICGVIFLCSCGEKRDQKILFARLSADVTTLDPALAVDVSSGMIAAKLFNGLVKYGKDMEIVPDIANKWEVSPDGCTYTFYLRQKVKFTNNREVEASDFKYSFERVLNLKTLSSRTWVFDKVVGAKEFMAGYTSEVSGLIVKDKWTFQIVLSQPFAPFLGFLAMPTAYVVPKEEVEKWKQDFSKHVIGTGPFKLMKWRNDEKIVLSANPDYFEGAPKIKGIEYRIIPEELTALAEFESGNLDVMGLPASEFKRFINHPKWKDNIASQVDMNVYYLGLNCQKPPLDKIEVRQALNYAINKEIIIKTVLENKASLSHGPIPSNIAGYCAELKPYDYDPQKARDLLSRAGLKDGFELKIFQKSSKEVLNIAEVIQAQLKDVGIKAEIIQVEWSALKEMINKGDTDSFYLAWVADYPDAENFLTPLFHSANWGSGGNRARYKNPIIDQLIDEAAKTIDTKKRLELYQQIEAKIVSEAPWVFLWHQKSYAIHQKWVKNYKLYPIYNADKGTNVELINHII